MLRRFSLGLLVLLLAACGSPSADPSPSASASAPVPAALLPGSEWILVGPASIKGKVTISFAADQLSGQAPVNRYFGPFTATDDGQMTLGPVASTMMAGDPDLMKAEQEYLGLLNRVDGFDSDGEQLSLRAGHEVLLRYAQPGTPAVFGATLVGKKVARAKSLAEAQGYRFRVISVDGEGRPATTDYDPQRLNAAVVDGRVTEVNVG